MNARLRKFTLASVVGLVVFASLVILEHLRHSGVFRTLEPHFAGSCQAMPLNASTVDIQIDRAGGFAYLAARVPGSAAADQEAAGTVLRLDLKVDPLVVQPALESELAGLRPQSMGLYTDIDGTQRLLVLNRPRGRSPAVEIFERAPDGRFKHTETIRSSLLLESSAIAAVGPRQFYVTNASGAHHAFERLIETLFRRALSSVVYFDGDVMRVVDDAVESGQGIAASADGGRLYVSEANTQAIRLYARDSASGDLTLLERIEIYTAPGNINVAEDGALWVVAHPKVPAFARSLSAAHDPVPTQILRVLTDPMAEIRAGEVYLNRGAEISAGSVAAVFSDRMLVGSFIEPKILVCHLPTT